MAGQTYPGRNMWVGIGIQSAMTTVATVFSYLQPTEVGGFLEAFENIESEKRLGTRFGGLPYVGTKSIPFNFTVEANPGDIGRILLAAMGQEYSTPSVTSVVHNHIFRFTAIVPYVTILGYLAGVADASGSDRLMRITGAKVGQITISGGIDDILMVSVEGVGMVASAVTAANYTPSYTSEKPFFLNANPGTGTLSIGSAIASAALFEEARQFEVTINNGLTPDHRIHGSATPVGIGEGSSSLEGQITAIHNQYTFAEINNFAAGNDRAITLTAVAAATTYTLPTSMATLEIGLNKCRYSGDTPSYDPDVITIELPFSAEVSLTSTYISVKNDKSVPYSASV
jgi:hypothetical protein